MSEEDIKWSAIRSTPISGNGNHAPKLSERDNYLPQCRTGIIAFKGKKPIQGVQVFVNCVPGSQHLAEKFNVSNEQAPYWAVKARIEHDQRCPIWLATLNAHA